MKSTAVKIAFIAILIVCAVVVARHYMKKTVDTSTPLQIVTDQSIDITPSQIRSIEQIGKWSFLEVSDEEIVVLSYMIVHLLWLRRGCHSLLLVLIFQNQPLHIQIPWSVAGSQTGSLRSAVQSDSSVG